MRWFRRRVKSAAVSAPVERVEGPLTPELVREVAARHLTAAGVEDLMRLLRPSTLLVPSKGEPSVGRLGGAAMLDADQAWPAWDGRNLQLVAALDLQELPEQADVPLPRQGWLNFFYDAVEQGAWGFDPAQREAWRVLVSSPAAQPVEVGESLPAVDLAAEAGWTLPDAFEDSLKGLRDSEKDALWAVFDELPEAGTVHRVGGWPDLVQNPVWLEAQLASHGIYVGGPAGYADPRVAPLRAGAKQWRLLLQIDSEDDANMMWGDVGRLYFLMTQADLQARQFDKTWMVLQCS